MEKIALINKILKFYEELESPIAILLIANMQTDAVTDDYERNSVTTSYSSELELNEMLLSFKEFAYVDVSYGEKDFIRKIQTDEFSDLDKYIKVVYTESASGTARSKSAFIPSLCELYGYKYCSNDIFTGALLDNKLATCKMLDSINIPIPKTWVYYHKKGWFNNEAPDLNIKLIAKPAYECASIGIEKESVSTYDENYKKFIHNKSIKFRQPILVQEFIEGYEVEVPIFDLEEGFVSGAIGISLNNHKELGSMFLTYDDVLDDGFDLFNYFDENSIVAKQIEEIAKKIYYLLQLTGPVRIDFRIKNNGEFYVMDYNNSPHLGKQHTFSKSLEYLGYSHVDMLKIIVYPSIKKLL